MTAVTVTLGLSLLVWQTGADEKPAQPDQLPKLPKLQRAKKKSLFKRDKSDRSPRSKLAPDEDAPPTVEGRKIPKPGDLNRPESDLDLELMKDLGQDLENAAEQDGNPLMRVGRNMREVEERLARLEADDETVALQRKIIADLEKLLQQPNAKPPQDKDQKKKKDQKKQQKQQQQMQRQQQQQQANTKDDSKSGERSGSPRSARSRAPRDLNEIKDVWGHLGEMLREEMSQYAKDKFLPKYRELLERYYTEIANQSKKASE